MLTKNISNQKIIKVILILILIYLVFRDKLMENYTIRDVYKRLREYLSEKEAKLMILHILLETGIRRLDVKVKDRKIDFMSDITFENVRNNNLLNIKDWKTGNYAKFSSLKHFIETALSIYIGTDQKMKYRSMLENACKYDKEQMIAVFCSYLVYYKFCVGKGCSYQELFNSFLSLYNAYWDKL